MKRLGLIEPEVFVELERERGIEVVAGPLGLGADVPSVKEQDRDVTITGNRLTIAGTREQEKVEENDNYYSTECSYGSFSRSFTLPDGIDADHIHADLKSGVLTVAVPKRPEVQAKQIAVKTVKQ